MSAKDHLNLYVLTVALFVECKATQCIVLTVNVFIQCTKVLYNVISKTRDKMDTVTFHENQKLNLENRYHEDAI